MRRFLLLSLLSISLAGSASVLLSPASAHPLSLLQEGVGEAITTRYSAYIETPRAAVSGICILAEVGDTIRGSLFNEFGITVLDFTWNRQKDKVRLHSVLPALDKWYIRRTLRHDLRCLLHALRQGQGAYRNERRHITYSLEELKD